MYKSITDSISDALSPVIRSLEDLQHSMLGSLTNLLRIKKETVDAWAGNGGLDVFGDASERAWGEVVDNCFLKYPNKMKMEILSSMASNGQVQQSVNPEENLPVEMFIRFSGDPETTSSRVQRGDILIDYVKDELGNIIPIFLQVTQIFGSFNTKNIVRKTANLVPYRGTFEKSIQDKVNLYLQKIIAGVPL